MMLAKNAGFLEFNIAIFTPSYQIEL